MTAWVSYTDPLCVAINQAYAGHNWKDNRSIWHGRSKITFGLGGIVGAQWYRDRGPRGMEIGRLEPRAFCLKGTATIAFTGRTLIARLNVAYSWFTGATVLIDGVAPSTLGLLASTDTLSCDAATYQLFADDYIDVVVADGLTDAPHTCLITVNSQDSSQFFSIAGYKVSNFTSKLITRDNGWLVPISTLLDHNLTTFNITNRSGAVLVDPTFSFPAGLVNASGDPLVTLTAANLGPGQTLSQTVLPIFTGQEHSGAFPFAFTVSAKYPDSAGSIVATTTVTALVGNDALNVVGTWFSDTSTPTAQTRLFTNNFAAHIGFTFSGDTLTLTVQQAASWGDFGLYAAVDNTTLLQTISCNVDSPVLGVHTFTGFGAGDHSVFLRKKVDDSAFVVFVAASWSLTRNFTEISETMQLNFVAHQPVAMPVLGVEIGDFDATFDAPIPDTQDYVGTPVRKNTDLAYTEVLTRFPAYAVCYQSGFFDILSQYDILIVDPIGANTADVVAWQAQGIKVYGYISSGEEVGFYDDRYDFASPLAPFEGDGLGPGGKAAYFMYTANPVTGPPDRDGVWAAYYCNPDPTFGWPQRLEEYYAPQVLGGPVAVVDEVVTTKTVTITRGSVIVFDTAQSPLDAEQPIMVKTMDGTTTYVTYSDYTFDAKTGAFVLSTTIAPAVTAGAQLKISYTRKGHYMDGVFFDVVDTPDVYSSDAFGYQFVAGYAEQFATMINNFAAAHPDAKIISNRGFTILPDIIKSCHGVMFETWLTTVTDIHHLTTTDYVRITNPDDIAYNEAAHTLLRQLRLTHEFDVYSLNYCHPDSRGDELRAYCRAEDAKRGYLSWQSTITLDTPTADSSNTGSPIGGEPSAIGYAFTRYKTKKI